MLDPIGRYFSQSAQAIIRKGAVMSEKDARRNKFFAIASPLFFALILFIEITEPSQTFARQCLVWWLLGTMALSSVVLPMTLYGYHNRHQMNVDDEEPLDYSLGLRGALVGVALVPLGRMLFEYFGVG